MLELVTLFAVVTTGALITSLTGLGGGSLILAVLLLMFPPQLAIPLHTFTQVSANVLRTGISLKSVKWKVVAAYGALMLPATWVAGLLFDLINPSWLKIVVGSFLLISVVPMKWKPRGETRLSTFVFLGAISGFLGVFVGSVGPMVTPFFNRLKIGREGVLTTKSASQMVMQLAKLVAFSGAAQIDFGALKGYVWILVCASLAGVLISLPIGKKISDDKLELAVNVLLGCISLKILFEGVSELLSA